MSLTLAASLALALAGCDREAPEAAQESARTALVGEIDRTHAGELMPAVNLRSVKSEVLNLGALQGTPVLLNLWATWCAPCVREMPLLDELAEDYDGRIRVVAASQDTGDGEKVTQFFAARDFARLEPWLDPSNLLMTALDADQLPTTIMYDANGQEEWRVIGDLDWSSEAARDAIDKAIAPEIPPE